jgi:hypothetical protein
MFLRHQRGDHLQILIGLFDTDLFIRVDAMLVEVIGKRLNEGFAQLVARAFRATAADIAR